MTFDIAEMWPTNDVGDRQADLLKAGWGSGADTVEDDDEIAYFTVRRKTRELVLSTAPKTWDNTDKDSKNRKRSH